MALNQTVTTLNIATQANYNKYFDLDAITETQHKEITAHLDACRAATEASRIHGAAFTETARRAATEMNKPTAEKILAAANSLPTIEAVEAISQSIYDNHARAGYRILNDKRDVIVKRLNKRMNELTAEILNLDYLRDIPDAETAIRQGHADAWARLHDLGGELAEVAQFASDLRGHGLIAKPRMQHNSGAWWAIKNPLPDNFQKMTAHRKIIARAECTPYVPADENEANQVRESWNTDQQK